MPGPAPGCGSRPRSPSPWPRLRRSAWNCWLWRSVGVVSIVVLDRRAQPVDEDEFIWPTTGRMDAQLVGDVVGERDGPRGLPGLGRPENGCLLHLAAAATRPADPGGPVSDARSRSDTFKADTAPHLIPSPGSTNLFHDVALTPPWRGFHGGSPGVWCSWLVVVHQ